MFDSKQLHVGALDDVYSSSSVGHNLQNHRCSLMIVPFTSRFEELKAGD